VLAKHGENHLNHGSLASNSPYWLQKNEIACSLDRVYVAIDTSRLGCRLMG